MRAPVYIYISLSVYNLENVLQLMDTFCIGTHTLLFIGNVPTENIYVHVYAFILNECINEII